MSDMEFLLWVRGPAFDIALTIFAFGVVLRLLEILWLGRKPDFAVARASGAEAGLNTIFRRFAVPEGTFKTYAFTVITGYLFHAGLFISLFFYAPHIEVLKNAWGIYWPALPTPVVDFSAVLAIIALIAILLRRVTHPLLRFLSGFEDYLTWTVTFLPLVTGYLTYHHMLMPYQQMLAWHILSVELLMIVFPFTKLMHAFTLFLARFYTGSASGRKGVQI